MTLSFSTVWPERMGELAGQPNYFVEKILKSLPDKKNYYPAMCGHCGWKGMSSLCNSYAIADTGDYTCSCPKCNKETIDEWEGVNLLNDGYYLQSDVLPKLHTIRYDPHNRWKPGMKIHFVINNRTKNRFQFAPVLECVSVQDIRIIRLSEKNKLHSPVIIDGHTLDFLTKTRLAINDGFPAVDAFFDWFNEDTKPNTKIIHWTNLKY